METTNLGKIILLNGVPRAGKTSILEVIQATFDGPWCNLGADTFVQQVIPRNYLPGGKHEDVGFRMEEIPGSDPPLRRISFGPAVQTVLPAMNETIAVHSRLGLNVVADTAFMTADLMKDCVQRLAGLPVLYVGVHCPADVILERRNVNPENRHATGDAGEAAARWWEQEITRYHGRYDLEVDTSQLSPEACAEKIRNHLSESRLPDAFDYLLTHYNVSA